MQDQRNRKRLAGGLLLALMLGGCSWAPVTPATGTHADGTSRSDVQTVGEQAVVVALEQLGAPYRYGGSRPDGFDCSGLVSYSYAAVGVRTPRSTRGLWRWAAPVGREQLRRGDIVFFDIDGKPSHVGLYLGAQRFVHAPSSGGTVSIRRLDDPFYRHRFLRGGRLPARL